MNILIEAQRKVKVMFKRVFLVVMDSVGVGSTEDSDKYGDKGANTVLHTIGEAYNLDVLEKLGLTNLVGKDEKDVSKYI